MPDTNQSYLTIGDILKSEADYHNRVAINAPDGVKCGQPILYEPRGEYLIALSDTEYGKVLVQPHNCVIYQDNIDMTKLAAIEVDTGEVDESGDPIMGPLTIDILKAQGDKHGIKYITTNESAT